jgi:hypothetical protein
MAKDPAYLFYDADAARDVSHMNRLERGAYFDIMQAQKKFGKLSMEQIKKVLGNDFENCWNNLSLALIKSATGYYIQWLEDSIEKRKAYCQGRSANRMKKKSAEVVPVGTQQTGTREPLVQRMAGEWTSHIQGYAFSMDADYPALLDFAKFICEQLKIPLDMLKSEPIMQKWKQMIRVIDDHPSWRKKSLLNLAKFNKQEIYSRIADVEEKRMII